MVSPCGRSRGATRWATRATCGRSGVGSPSARPPVTLQGDAAGSRGSWIDAAVDQHAPVVALGALCGDVAEIEIALHLIHRTIERIAVAGAAGQAKLEDLVRRGERHERADAIVVNDPAFRVEHHTAHGATRAPTEEARRARHDPVRVQAGQRRTAVVEELADADHLTKTAPVTAGAARVGDEPLFEDEHRRARLEELDRGVGGAGGPEQRRLPIAPR